MVKGGDPFPLLGTGDIKAEELGPVLDSPVPKQYTFKGVSPVKSHKDDWGTGTSFIWRQGERAGAVQPREENAEGDVTNMVSFFEFFFTMGREVHELFKKYAHHGFLQCHHDAWFSILFLIIAVILFAFSASAIIHFFKELFTVSLVSFSEDVVSKVKPTFGSVRLKFFSPFPILHLLCWISSAMAQSQQCDSLLQLFPCFAVFEYPDQY